MQSSLASALASQFTWGHAEMLAALANEVGRVGQSYPEPDTADAQAVKARVGQHSVRGCHPALIQDPANSLVALPDDVVDGFAQPVAMPFGSGSEIFLSQGRQLTGEAAKRRTFGRYAARRQMALRTAVKSDSGSIMP